MPTMIVTSHDGSAHEAHAAAGSSVMDAIRDAGFDEPLASCSGCSGATSRGDVERQADAPPTTNANEDHFLDGGDHCIAHPHTAGEGCRAPSLSTRAAGSRMTGTGGPLVGLRVIEFASIGPGPHCAMLLADQGADVVRLDREGGNGWPNPILDRGRTVVTLDIRSDEGRAAALALCDAADVVIEGLRPGVMERLGLGPDELLGRIPRLVYGRMTGWGQTGPLARTAGHDINFIALTGALDAVGGRASVRCRP